jgi:hypothetical protein
VWSRETLMHTSHYLFFGCFLIFSPLSASDAHVCSPSLSRADSLLLHLHIDAQPCLHATPHPHRDSDTRDSDVNTVALSHLVSHSQPAPSPAPSHAPGHLLQRLMFSALLCYAASGAYRLLVCVRATVTSIRIQPCCMLFKAPRHLLMCPVYNLSSLHTLAVSMVLIC